MKQFTRIAPISDDDPNAIPVKEIGPAVKFYTQTLGFAVVSADAASAVLQRDDVQVGLVAKPDHNPATAGSFYLAVNDLEAMRTELETNGGKPGAIGVQSHEGTAYRVFFLRECDMMDVHDGYCFCFGHPV